MPPPAPRPTFAEITTDAACSSGLISGGGISQTIGTGLLQRHKINGTVPSPDGTTEYLGSTGVVGTDVTHWLGIDASGLTVTVRHTSVSGPTAATTGQTATVGCGEGDGTLVSGGAAISGGSLTSTEGSCRRRCGRRQELTHEHTPPHADRCPRPGRRRCPHRRRHAPPAHRDSRHRPRCRGRTRLWHDGRPHHRCRSRVHLDRARYRHLHRPGRSQLRDRGPVRRGGRQRRRPRHPQPARVRGPRGAGGHTRATLAVTPGEVLQLTVGAADTPGSSRRGEYARPGGYGHGAGGGATSTSHGTGSPNSRLGGPGAPGGDTDPNTGLPNPGSGGAGGNGGRGGNGGGGGGGGWFGGGGGSGGGNPDNLPGAGGGGGSGHADPTTTGASLTSGVHRGDGRAALTWRYDTSLALTADTTTPLYGRSTTVTATVTSPAGSTPSGSVAFLDGDAPLGTVPLADGRAVKATRRATRAARPNRSPSPSGSAVHA
ncbi:hypothetical protein ABZ946_19885 [Streptomyces sp. NPDC046324]|uniref:Ig-like domain repeat protein n=1 Tax=Streptomyces sp. NPDC046324 TaxID=3154915 RepID=UPI0033C94D95